MNNTTQEAWEEEQMSNLGCESVSDLIAEIERLNGLLAKAGLCGECGLDHLGYADYEYACKCNEGDEDE